MSYKFYSEPTQRKWEETSHKRRKLDSEEVWADTKNDVEEIERGTEALKKAAKQGRQSGLPGSNVEAAKTVEVADELLNLTGAVKNEVEAAQEWKASQQQFTKTNTTSNNVPPAPQLRK